jgi:hypothetical protein
MQENQALPRRSAHAQTERRISSRSKSAPLCRWKLAYQRSKGERMRRKPRLAIHNRAPSAPVWELFTEPSRNPKVWRQSIDPQLAARSFLSTKGHSKPVGDRMAQHQVLIPVTGIEHAQ